MKRFRFPLATALRVRRIQEDQARLALGQARLAAEIADDAARAALGRYAVVDATHGPLPHPGASAVREAHERSGQAVQRADERAATAHTRVADRRAEWARANSAVEALERLAQRRRAEWEQQAGRVEAQELDDLVAARRAWREADRA